jgi:hypothetical protein
MTLTWDGKEVAVLKLSPSSKCKIVLLGQFANVNLILLDNAGGCNREEEQQPRMFHAKRGT